MSENKLPTLKMKKDELVPEGDYPATCQGMEMIDGYLRFQFRITDHTLDNPFVSGLCDVKDNRSSRLMRWIMALTSIEYEEGRDIDLEELLTEIAGAHCFVRVKHREGDDQVFSNVVQVFAHNDPRFANTN